MPEPLPGWLTDDVIAAITGHMNADHGTDNVEICRRHGAPHATEAVMTGLTDTSIEFTIDAGEIVRIPFPEPVTDRPGIRQAVVALLG